MKVFNLAEELEKERKKNKKLQEENKKLSNVIYKDYVVKDLENKNYWLKNDNEAYKSRIDKAIEHLTIKQARYINEKDYILNDEDLDAIMNILEGSDNND